MDHYNKHEMFMPKVGDKRSIYTLSNEELLAMSCELTEAEKRYPDAKYRDMLPAALPEWHIKAMGEPMNAADAFDIREYEHFMLDQRNCSVENGYCVLPSGITYAAALIRQEGRTDEMVRFYNDNFANEDSLFYKTWFPGSHYVHFPDGCLEDFGFGRCRMCMDTWVAPHHIGIDVETIKEKDPDCIQIGGSSGLAYNLDSEEPDRGYWSTIVFYHRHTNYGREVRIRLWFGIGVDDQGYHITPPEKKDALIIAKCTMSHLMQEYTNDHFLETSFFNKESGTKNGR